MRQYIYPLLALGALSACDTRDAASEAPVDLKAGLYEVRAMGSGFFETIDRPGRSEVCLTEFGAKEWPAHPLEKTMRKWTGCSDAIDPPRGNALSGKRSCPKASATFEGSHTEDKFAIKGVVKWNDDGREETFAITGRRTGDC